MRNVTFSSLIRVLVAATASAFVAPMMRPPSRIGSALFGPAAAASGGSSSSMLREKKRASEADKLNPDGDLIRVLYTGDSQRNLVSGDKFLRDVNAAAEVASVRRQRFVKKGAEQAVMDEHHNTTGFAMDDVSASVSSNDASTITDAASRLQLHGHQSLVDEMPTMTLPQLTKCLRERRMEDEQEVRRLKRDNVPMLVESKRLSWAMACSELAEICFTRYVREGQDVKNLLFDEQPDNGNDEANVNPTYTFLQEVAAKNASSSYMDVLQSSLQTYGFGFRKVTALPRQMKLSLDILTLNQDYQDDVDQILGEILSDVLNGDDVSNTTGFAKHLTPLLATTSVRVRKQEQNQHMQALQQKLADVQAAMEMNECRIIYIDLARECFFQCAYETGDNVLHVPPTSLYQSVLQRLANPQLYPQDHAVLDQYLARHGLRCVQFQTLETGGARIAVGLLPEGTHVGFSP